MPGGRRRRRVPWFSFIPLTTTTVSASTTTKGKTINTINTMASALDYDDNLNNFFPTTDFADLFVQFV